VHAESFCFRIIPRLDSSGNNGLHGIVWRECVYQQTRRSRLNPERWQEVSRIFRSAIELDGEAREAYLATECAHDDSIREEVSRLISSHEKASAEDFINTPPNAKSNSSDSEDRRLTNGQWLGPYQVMKHLGTGGMGEVYLATDTRLDRLVALKILSAELAHDKRRMQRFQREARIVSSLNHPNILTLFEFGEIESLHFLATEYVDGQTLRQYLKKERLQLTDILDITLQICAALETAHESKIVHRDIKPENVMIRRRDHIVKVLDFGLAKGTELTSVTHATDSEVATKFKTAAGNILGTVNYMSPEQAQGLPVDERTDLWSTGVIIYEMVTGHAPFKGRTSSHTIVQILEKEPLPLTHAAGFTLPAELERIIDKALAKQPDERYQTAKDLRIDLHNLRKQLDRETEFKRSGEPLVTEQSSKTTSTIAAASTNETSRSLKKAKIVKLVILLAMLALVSVALWQLNYRRLRQAATSTDTSAPVTELALTYSITVQKYRDNRPFEPPFQLAKEMLFESDYEIRLNVNSKEPGFLYILNEGPHDKGRPPDFVVLFPAPTSNGGSALVSASQPIQIPEKSWIKFDKEQGTERVWLVFAPKAVPELEPIRSYASQPTQGLITDAGLRDNVQHFFRKQGEAKPSVEQNAERKETTISSRNPILVHVISLEHQ
jgi:serine/threonine protein kinase